MENITAFSDVIQAFYHYIENDVDFFSYFELSEEENKTSIKIMVIGPTGSGKTTLLNSYINPLLPVRCSHCS